MQVSTRSILKILTVTALFIGALYLAYRAERELVWVGTAFFLAVALNPAVDRLTGWMPRRNRLLGAVSVSVLLLLFVALLGVLFVPPIVSQTQDLINNLPSVTNHVVQSNSFVADQVRKFNLVEKLQQSQNEITHYLSTAGGSVYGFVRGLFNSLAAFVTIIVMTFFMMLEGPKWVAAFWRAVPKARRAHGQMLATKMYHAVTGYVNGNLLTSLVAAVATAVVLTIIRVPYAIPLGIFVGLVDLIPLVGATLAAIVVVIVSLFTSVTAAIIMIIFYIIYQQIENHVLQPIVYGRTVEMSPLLVLVAILTGASIGGIIGAFVAIPIFASLQILIRDYADRHFTD